jgi:hypothetical protein
VEESYRGVDRKGERNYTRRKKEMWIERKWQAQADKKAQNVTKSPLIRSHIRH